MNKRILVNQRSLPLKLNSEQIKRVVDAVRKTFAHLRNDPVVLPQSWRDQNLKSTVVSTGFCSSAANAVYHLLGGKAAGLTPMVASYFDPDLKDSPKNKNGNNATHWWIRTADGAVIDPTSDQYTSFGQEPPYKLGRGSGFNTKLTVPTKAGRKIMDMAIDFLKKEGFLANGISVIQKND